jgi:predicted phage terminase large subunit-like protein
VKPTAGRVFPRIAWGIAEAAPKKNVSWVRYWDKAGTEEGGDWTVGCLMGYAHDEQRWYVADVVRGQYSSSQREAVIRQTAELDGIGVSVFVEQEPGSSGKESAENTIHNLRGFKVYSDRVTGDKETRARPLSAQQQIGNVYLVRGEWVPEFLRETEAFPTTGVHDDQVDAASGAFNRLATVRPPSKSKDWHTHKR